MKKIGAEKAVGAGILKNEGGEPAFFVRPAVIAAAGAVLCPAQFFFGSYPFGAALIAAVSGPISAPAALLGTVLGCMLIRGGAVMLPVLVSLFLGRIAIGMILSRDGGKGAKGASGVSRFARFVSDCASVRYTESVYIRMAIASAASLAGGVVFAASGAEGAPGFASAVASSVISPLFVWLFCASPLWEPLCPGGGIKTRDGTLREAGTIAILAALTLSFYAIRIPVVDLGSVCAFVLTVISVRRRGIPIGVLRGLVCGAVISPRAAPLFAICALAGGLVSRVSDTGSVFASAAAGVLWGYRESGLAVLSGTLPEMIVGVAVTVPAVALGFLPRAERRTGRARPAPRREKRAEEDRTGRRLSELSDGLASVSRDLFRISDELTAPSREQIKAICDEAFAGICSGCGLRHACDTAERADVERVKEEIVSQLAENGRASASAVSKTLAGRCYNVDAIIDSVNRAFSKKAAEAKVFDRTAVVASDYEAVADMLKDAARADRDDSSFDEETTRALSRRLPDSGFAADGIAVYGKRKKRIVATGVRLPETSLGSEQIRELFGGILGVRFGAPSFSISGDAVDMELSLLPKLKAEHGEASVAARDAKRVGKGEPIPPPGVGQSVCGDAVGTFETGDGRLFMLISDGMGSGKEASVTAGMCVSFLRRMLTSGAEMGTALKMLNSMIRARGTECSATVDLMEVDLITGKARFVKSGAAPSFVIRGGRLFRLQSKTAPIGIIRALDAEMIAFDVEPGDTVVMLSDGVARSFEEAPWLCDLLGGGTVAENEPEDTAKTVVRLAAEYGSTDDITVGVVKFE
ncbi:MAG: SpoIIE family protein phosphatase [Clostridia bacterium]|nr:SpoIIE family protein phosphatase [Clostridia bacterium]